MFKSDLKNEKERKHAGIADVEHDIIRPGRGEST